jgi:hypothetical protein
VKHETFVNVNFILIVVQEIDLEFSHFCSAEGQRGGLIEVLATVGSIVLMVLTFPISVFICFKGMFEIFLGTLVAACKCLC